MVRILTPLLFSFFLLASVWSAATADTTDEHKQAPHALKRKKVSVGANTTHHVQQEREPRIVGGNPVQADKYPYFARVDNAKSGARGICGASLVAPDIVLTAGHCLNRELKVVVNGYNRSRKKLKTQRNRRVSAARRHPQYNGTTWENDYLLLKMRTKVDMDPIPLNFNASIPQTGDNLIAIGMGRQTEAGNLSFTIRDVTIPAADQKACADAYQQLEPPRQVVNKNMFCAGTIEKSPCKGDSGGPLLTTGANKTLVGIISWGAGCGRKNFPTVFARISGAEGWLTNNLCEMSEYPPSWCPPPPPTPVPLPATRRPTVQSTPRPTVKASPRPTVKAPPSPATAPGPGANAPAATRRPTVTKTTPRPTKSPPTLTRAPTVRKVTTYLTDSTLVPTEVSSTTTAVPLAEPTLVPTGMKTLPTEPTLGPTPNVVP